MLTDAWTLLTLTLLETILSVDNLIFISLAIDKVPNALRERVRLMGLGLALLMRFVILFLHHLYYQCKNLYFTLHQQGIYL